MSANESGAFSTDIVRELFGDTVNLVNGLLLQFEAPLLDLEGAERFVEAAHETFQKIVSNEKIFLNPTKDETKMIDKVHGIHQALAEVCEKYTSLVGEYDRKAMASLIYKLMTIVRGGLSSFAHPFVTVPVIRASIDEKKALLDRLLAIRKTEERQQKVGGFSTVLDDFAPSPFKTFLGSDAVGKFDDALQDLFSTLLSVELHGMNDEFSNRLQTYCDQAKTSFRLLEDTQDEARLGYRQELHGLIKDFEYIAINPGKPDKWPCSLWENGAYIDKLVEFVLYPLLDPMNPMVDPTDSWFQEESIAMMPRAIQWMVRDLSFVAELQHKCFGV